MLFDHSAPNSSREHIEEPFNAVKHLNMFLLQRLHTSSHAVFVIVHDRGHLKSPMCSRKPQALFV